ncbi:MAG: TetM/TetW/TetO/TetS family tetracycline resistance ribosomal protection protein [Oscillospiraceae bacterium]|nr:TetM/TetW/TetO/TetS family tetracycline resistance ribosomal protection protein [Oscillospiraceae bacterium]
MMKVVNLGILAHVDAGKTTLSERMLYVSGAVRSLGGVDMGNAHMDNMEIERERGISVKSSSAQLIWGEAAVNVIDTPGHMEFGGEVERSLCALDNAVLVVSAVEGVQPQTETIWKALSELKIPAMFYINKTDAAGADVGRVLGHINERFKIAPLFFDSLSLGEAVAERLAENDEELFESYMESGLKAFSPHEKFIGCLKKQYAARVIFPAVAGSALGKNEDDRSVAKLLDLISQIGAAAAGDPNGELGGIVYKIEHSKSLGRIAHMRLFNGSAAVRGTIYSETKKTEEKITQIKKYDGVKLKDSPILSSGEIGIVCGLSGASVGDIYGNGKFVRQGYKMTTPLISVRVLPDGEDRYPELVEATSELFAEDPLLDMVWVKEERELVIAVTGLIQMEILANIYKKRFGLEVKLIEPSIIYKETIDKPGYGFEAYTMPKPCWAVLKFLMEPLPRGSGYEFVNKTRTEQILERYISQVRQALPEALKQGPKGFEATDIKFTLVDGESHVMHTHPLDFIVATPMAVMNGLAQIGTILLEPILKFKIEAEENLSGKIIGEILAMRGTFEPPAIKNGQFIIEGLYPLATSLKFPERFAALTSGRARLHSEFYGYEKCPPGVEACRPYRGISPLDRAKYILRVRHAL